MIAQGLLAKHTFFNTGLPVLGIVLLTQHDCFLDQHSAYEKHCGSHAFCGSRNDFANLWCHTLS